MAGWDRQVIDIHPEQHRENQPTLRHASPNVMMSRCDCLEGRFKPPVMQVRGDGFYNIQRQVKDSQLLKETIDPHGIESLSNV